MSESPKSLAQKKYKGSPRLYRFYLWVIAQSVRIALIERCIRWRLDQTAPHKKAQKAKR